MATGLRWPAPRPLLVNPEAIVNKNAYHARFWDNVRSGLWDVDRKTVKVRNGASP